MKPSSLKPSLLTDFSEQLYRHLLILYPSRFRQEFGGEMALVFRSHCRTLVGRYGEGALIQLWFSTLTDLISTALTERMKEGFSMSKVMWVQLSAIFSLLGGLLGLYLLTMGTNEYGNYGWQGPLTPVAAILLAIGLAGWFTIYHEQIPSRGWLGFFITLSGFLSMAVGYLVGNLWFFIFVGPLLLVPIGAIILGLSTSRIMPLPAWWRYFPFVLATIGILGFGIEVWETIIQDPVPDRGLMMAQLLFSVVWLGLGIGLWVAPKHSTSQPSVM